MFYTDEQGLNHPTNRQEQEWNEANAYRDEDPSPEPDESELGGPTPAEDLNDCPPEPEDLPF